MTADHSHTNRPDDDNQDKNRNESIEPYSSIKTKAPIRFTSWNGSEYPATLTNITYRGERGDHGEDIIIKIVITMSVEEDTMRQLLAEQSFHTWPHTFISPAHFEEGEPIEIRAMLDPALAKQINKQKGDAETVLAALLPAEAGLSNVSALTYAEYWYLLQAMQNISLPPELQQTGKVRQGFRTIWQQVLTETIEVFSTPSPFSATPASSTPASSTSEGSASVDSTSASESEFVSSESFSKTSSSHVISDSDDVNGTNSSNDDINLLANDINLLAQVENVLNAEKLSYERFSEDIIRIPFRDDSGSWVLLIRIDQELELLNLYSVFPERIPASKRPQIALMLINEHYNFTSGNFEMDVEDGEVRFRSTLNCNAGWDDEIFRSLLGDHLKIVEIYFPLLQHLQ